MPERVTRSVALSGQISATPLVDVLSTVSSSGKSAEVRVHTEFGVCCIWFQNGELFDASFNEQRGEEAVARLAGVGEGRFEVEYRESARERVIHTTVQRIFQDCANRRRLWRDLVKHPPRLKAVLGVVEKWRHDGERIIPETHAGLLGLFDGHNTVLDAIEKLGQEAVRTLAIIHHLYEVGILVVIRVDEDSPASSSFPPGASPTNRASSPASADVVWSIRESSSSTSPGQSQSARQAGSMGEWVPATPHVLSDGAVKASPGMAPVKLGKADQRKPLQQQALAPSGAAPATLKGPPPAFADVAAATMAGSGLTPSFIAPATLRGPQLLASASPPVTLKGPPHRAPVSPTPSLQGPAPSESVKPLDAQVSLVPTTADAPANARTSAVPPRPTPRKRARQEVRSLTPPSLPLAVNRPCAGEESATLDWQTSQSAAPRTPPTSGAMPSASACVGKVEEGTAAASVENDRVLGRYEVLCRLGRGGMGSVYLCRTRGELGFRRLYALKVLRQRVDGDPETERFFLHEAYVASRLHHPNVVAVVDAAVHGSQPYIIMDYVEGCSLHTLISRGGELRTPAVVLSVIMDALNGLHAAHTMTDEEGNRIGLVHCDVSPENLLVGVEGTCRLSDFGVARARNLPGARSLSGSARGKARYASPEQASGVPVDARSDVFSMGVVLHEALTGVPLFVGATVEETLERVLRLPIPPPSQVGARPPKELDAICLKALERDPSKRFASAAEMLVELRRTAVQCGLLASPEDVGQWVRAIAQPELEMQRLASLDALQHARFHGEDGRSLQLPRALSIPPPAVTGYRMRGADEAVEDSGNREDQEDGQNLALDAGDSTSDEPEGTIELKRPPRLRNAVLILASIIALGAVVASVLFPEAVAAWFKLDVGGSPLEGHDDPSLTPQNSDVPGQPNTAATTVGPMPSNSTLPPGASASGAAVNR